MSKYLAILGRQPELGLVELESILGPDQIQPFGPAAILSEPHRVRPCAGSDPALDLNRLGGTVKIGRIMHQSKFTGHPDVNLDQLPLPAGKITFGLSVHG